MDLIISDSITQTSKAIIKLDWDNGTDEFGKNSFPYSKLIARVAFYTSLDVNSAAAASV
jgi:hypothetical protein